jgi:MATE family multidrug resistance protein
MWGMFLAFFIYSKHNVILKHYFTFKSLKINLGTFKEIILIGLPSGLLLVLESGMFLFAAIVMGYFGVSALAAHQIAMQCASIAYAIPFALSMATALQVGHALGAKNVAQAQRAAFIGLGMGLILTLILAVCFICFPAPIARIFLEGHEHDSQTIVNMSATFLMIAGLFQCFDGVQAIANGALRGLKDTFVPMILSMGCYWIIGVGSAYYFAFKTQAGPAGIWYGFTLGLSSIGIILIFRLLNRLKFEKQSCQSLHAVDCR